MKIVRFAIVALVMVAMVSCSSIPKGVKAVEPFDKNQYLGKWYEVARFDFAFERNLDNTTAEYALNPNGTIAVLNRGYHVKKQEWKQAKGKAKFAGAENVGRLKVSFFGPFFAGYNVLAVDPQYKYALVAGKNRDYLWILSRETVIPAAVKNEYLQIAEKNGFDTKKLIWVKHDTPQPKN